MTDAVDIFFEESSIGDSVRVFWSAQGAYLGDPYPRYIVSVCIADEMGWGPRKGAYYRYAVPIYYMQQEEGEIDTRHRVYKCMGSAFRDIQAARNPRRQELTQMLWGATDAIVVDWFFRGAT